MKYYDLTLELYHWATKKLFVWCLEYFNEFLSDFACFKSPPIFQRQTNQLYPVTSETGGVIAWIHQFKVCGEMIASTEVRVQQEVVQKSVRCADHEINHKQTTRLDVKVSQRADVED